MFESFTETLDSATHLDARGELFDGNIFKEHELAR